MIPAKARTAPEVDLAGLDPDFVRADIEFHDVDHSGASFEGRVFLNNPEANETTEQTPDAGYAGAFHIFGHGGCFGDEGHCDVAPRRPYDPRPAHQLSPARKVVIATDAVRRAMDRGPTASITVVPMVTSLTEKSSTEDVLRFDSVSIVTYR